MKNSKQNKTKQKKSNDVLLETVIVVSLHEWGKKKRDSGTCADEETGSQLFQQMKHQMMYLDALESAKVELSLISKCNEKEEEEEKKQLAL